MERAAQSTDEWILPVLREMLTSAQLAAIAKDTTASKWCVAVSNGFTTDDAILRAIARRTRMRVAGALTSSPQAVARVPERLARRYSILPLSVSANTIDVATANPYDLHCEQAIAFAAGRRVRMSLALPARITERLEEVYRPASVVERLLASVGPVSVHQVEPETDPATATQLADGARERPIIKARRSHSRRGDRGESQRHSSRIGRRRHFRSVPRGWRIANGDDSSARDRPSARVARQDNVAPRHRRSAASAGRTCAGDG